MTVAEIAAVASAAAMGAAAIAVATAPATNNGVMNSNFLIIDLAYHTSPFLNI